MIMHYIAIMLEVMLVAVAVMMCFTMPQYKAKGRTLIASTGIVLAISYLVINAGEPIVWRFALFNSFDQAIHYLQLISILTYCLDILIFLYLFFVSIKIHSKFLSSVIALSGSAKVIIEVIMEIFWWQQADLSPLKFGLPTSPISPISLILELAILIVFVIVLKQNKEAAFYNQLQETMGSSKTCPNCGSPVSENKKFCTKCGTPVNN